MRGGVKGVEAGELHLLAWREVARRGDEGVVGGGGVGRGVFWKERLREGGKARALRGAQHAGWLAGWMDGWMMASLDRRTAE